MINQSWKELSIKLVDHALNNLKNIDSNYLYHNVNHTINVVNYTHEIANNSSVSDNDLKLLLTAALLHDYGFVQSHIDHEKIGAKLSEDILLKFDYNIDDINIIQKLIISTDPNKIARNKLEGIIKDADLAYLGNDTFSLISEELKKEWLHFKVVDSELSFYNAQYNFLSNHEFNSNYMKNKCSDGKKNNLKLALDKLNYLQNN